MTELARDARVPVATAHRELARLERAGVVYSTRTGNERRVAPNRSSPFYEELESLLRKAFGPVSVLRSFLEDVPGIEEAHVFGSWARRYLGEPGPAPQDVDVLVIGDVDPDLVLMACQAAEGQLGTAVDPTILSRREWDEAEVGFIPAIRAEQRVRILPE